MHVIAMVLCSLNIAARIVAAGFTAELARLYDSAAAATDFQGKETDASRKSWRSGPANHCHYQRIHGYFREVNIELAHFDLLRAGLATGADWVLILEDDASSTDVIDCAAGLTWLMSSRTDEKQPAYVNISQSFSLDELGLSHLLTPSPDASWAGETKRRILTSARPATNTVCAILYRGSFVRELLAVTDALPIEPVVPIDWKLNLALMQLFEAGGLGAGDCWFVDPAPIDQLSMRGTG